MRFFGIDINRARTAAAPKTAPVKKGLEVGDSGTPMFSGIVRDEYNPKLQGDTGIAVYDEMRRSDGTVRAAVSVCSMPIRSAKWYVEAATEDQADQDIAAFVEKCFFEFQTITFNDLMRHALLSLPFGVIAFEKVFATRDVDGQTRIVWDKLAPRMPRSIRKWVTEDGNLGITQLKSDGTLVDIPIEKLVIVVNEKEGDNWWGTSILRPTYKHWFMKNAMYKIDAIAQERQGLGIPYVKLPEGYSEADRSKAEDIVKNIRANEHAFIIEPPEYDIGFKDMMGKSTRDPSPMIEHHNREIMKSVLAQFLELGATNKSGSRALSEDHSELFLQSLVGTAQGVADAFNKYAVKEIVDLNFDGVTVYPKLTFTGISQVDAEALATTYQTLVTAGGVRIGSNDEQFFREALGLPERDPEDIVEPPATDPNIDPNNPDAAVANAKAKKEASERIHGVKKKITAAEDSADFKGFRPLTFAEKKVDFGAIQRAMDDLEAQFDQETRALLHDARDKFMAALTKAAHAGNTQAIKDATMKVQAEYAKIIKNASRTAFQYGKTNAAKEMGVNAPADPAETVAQIDIQANAIAQQQLAQITNEAKTAYIEALNKGNSITAALAAADAVALAAIDELIADTSAILMAGYVNHGRSAVYDGNGDKIYALQRSELLDSRTCNYCLSVDGRIIEKTDPFGQNTIFHSNCRGIWVSILTDEAEKPSIGGIPQSLKDRFGDAVNDLIQPRMPQNTRKSLWRAKRSSGAANVRDASAFVCNDNHRTKKGGAVQSTPMETWEPGTPWGRLREYISEELSTAKASLTHAKLGFGAAQTLIILLGFYAISAVIYAYLQDQSMSYYGPTLSEFAAIVIISIALIGIIVLVRLLNRLAKAFVSAINEELTLKAKVLSMMLSDFPEHRRPPREIMELLERMQSSSWGRP